MTEAKKGTSARGEVVDFELLRIKSEMSVDTPPIQRETRSRRSRRRLSERGAALARETTTEVPTTTVAPEDDAPKIVRKQRKTP